MKMKIKFYSVDPDHRIPPLKVARTGPVEVVEQVRRHAQANTGHDVLVDLDVRAGCGVLSDGHQPLGRFVIMARLRGAW